MLEVCLYTVPCQPSTHPRGWYIVLTRHAAKKGKSHFWSWLPYPLLCFSWILGLLYQEKKTLADGWEGTKKPDIVDS